MSDSNLPATISKEEQAAALAELGDEFTVDLGLEQFDESDFVMPRLNIQHETGLFQDNLSGEEFPEFEGILLGLIKQRILWHEDVDKNDGPMCKSYDFELGHPDVKTFPFKLAGFEPSDISPEGTLPCASCIAKDWGSHPSRDTPYCSEQHTLPILQVLPGGGVAPALLTLQRSGIRPSKAYLSGFARQRTPLFTTTTKISLTQQKRGSVNYSVPRFVKGEATDPGQYRHYAETWKQIKGFVTTPPNREAEEEVVPATTTPATAAAPTAAAADDDDLPF